MSNNLESELNCGVTCMLDDGTELNVGDETAEVEIGSRTATVNGVSGVYPQLRKFVCMGTGNAEESIRDGTFIPDTDDGGGDGAPPAGGGDDLETVGPYNIDFDDISSWLKISPRNVCKFKFNFYNSKYEKNIRGDQVSHNLLPSFYTNAYYSNHKDDASGFLENYSFVKQALTLDNTLEINNNKVVSTPSSTPATQVQEYGLRKYFVDYSYKLLEKIDAGDNMDDIKNKMSYIFIAPEEYVNFRKSESKKELFPFYNEINIPAKPLGRIGKFLTKYKKFDDFKINVANQLIPQIGEKRVKLADGSVIIKRIVPTSMTMDSAHGDYNALPWVITPSGEKIFYVFFEEGSRVSYTSHTLSADYISNLISDINFEQTYESDFANLSLDEDGNSNANNPEVLYYKVVKYKDSTSNPPVSIFCVANTEEVDNVSFVDTQVKINEHYIYQIYGIVYVQNNAGDQFLIQDKMTEVDNYTLNHPPMVPDFNVLPIINNDKQIKILFNESVGERLLDPISLSSEEGDRVEKLRLAQGRINTEEEFASVEAMSQETGYEFTAFGQKIFDNRLMYKNDDDIKMYEIYRLETAPRTVDDFRNATKIRVPKDSYTDTIEKNTKYYYMFRAIDSHGNISNPSQVIEVILVSSGYTYPIVKSYSYDDYQEKQKTFSRQAKRYIRISPLPSNLLVSTGNSPTTATDAQTATLNGGDIPLWGKRYKMRVTSKTTGKKVDFNFTFNQVFSNSVDDVV